MKPNSPLSKESAVRVAMHASEASGHWWTKRGELIEQVMKVDGSGYTRCTLAHARKLDLAPGCTTIIGCADKPALTLWKQRQAIMAALTLPRRDSETEKEWMDRVEDDMSETAANAAAVGSAIHAAIQSYVGGHDYDPAYKVHVRGAIDELSRVLGQQVWHAEQSVVSRLGVATKVDMVSNTWILNWKSKDGDATALADLNVYDDHEMQSGFEMDCLNWRHRAAIGFVSRTHPGVTRIVEIKQDELRRGFEMFKCLTKFWQTKNRFRPSWATESP